MKIDSYSKIGLKVAVVSWAAFVFLFFSCGAQAYILPKYKISDADMKQASETVLQNYSAKRDALCSQTCLNNIASYESKMKKRLSPPEMRALKDYRSLMADITFWKYVVSLKNELSSLAAGEKCKVEADFMAKTIVQRVYDISQVYRVGSTPLLQNWMINQGANRRGYCYHYVTDIRAAIKDYNWKCFDLHWGVANDKELDEHNVIVITGKNKPFETGIFIDAWRKGGKPIWKKVTDDEYEWKEAPNLEYE